MLLIPALKLGGTLVKFAAPYRKVERGHPGEGCQIDLLIGTERALYTIAVKRKHEIGAEIEHEMDRKIANLPKRRNQSIRTVLVFDGTLSAQLESDNYFDHLLPADQLLLGR